MVRTAVAFCPGHISGYFRKVPGRTPAETGSIGAGIVIDEGVKATARASDRVSVRVQRLGSQGEIINEYAGSEPIEYIIRRLGLSAEVRTTCRLPLSSGFGLSAAALLASLTALDTLFELGLDRKEIAALAHEAEIAHQSGLGDVAALQGGGVVCRSAPGTDAPITRMRGNPGPIVVVNFGPLVTSDVITSEAQMERVTTAYPLRSPEDIRDFFVQTRGFAEKSGLVTDEVARVFDACDRAGVPAGMTMLGNGVFAYGNEAKEVLSEFGEVYVMNIAERGFYSIGVKN